MRIRRPRRRSHSCSSPSECRAPVLPTFILKSAGPCLQNVASNHTRPHARPPPLLPPLPRYGRGMALASDLRASEAGTDAQVGNWEGCSTRRGPARGGWRRWSICASICALTYIRICIHTCTYNPAPAHLDNPFACSSGQPPPRSARSRCTWTTRLRPPLPAPTPPGRRRSQSPTSGEKTAGGRFWCSFHQGGSAATGRFGRFPRKPSRRPAPTRQPLHRSRVPHTGARASRQPAARVGVRPDFGKRRRPPLSLTPGFPTPSHPPPPPPPPRTNRRLAL